MADGGKGCINALGVGDGSAGFLVEGDVEVDANKDAFVSKIDGIQRELVHFLFCGGVVALHLFGYSCRKRWSRSGMYKAKRKGGGMVAA